jgi:hypothetical protein
MPRRRPNLVCAPHRERTGARILAARIVAGTPLCQNCFDGAAIAPIEEIAEDHSREHSKIPMPRHFFDRR